MTVCEWVSDFSNFFRRSFELLVSHRLRLQENKFSFVLQPAASITGTSELVIFFKIFSYDVRDVRSLQVGRLRGTIP